MILNFIFYIADIFVHYLRLYMLFIFCVYYICCMVIHVNSVHFAMFYSFITWQDVCCICTVGEL